MVSRYSNELNSFRSGIEDRVSQHKDKLSAVNQALGIKADKVFENAKKISDEQKENFLNVYSDYLKQVSNG